VLDIHFKATTPVQRNIFISFQHLQAKPHLYIGSLLTDFGT